MSNEAIEDYLKNIYEIQLEKNKVATTVLADRLNIKPASVTGMIKKLASLELVTYEPYHGIQLTTKGQQRALNILRNHRLIELFLVKKLGISWDEFHAEAEKLEHAISAKLVQRMDEVLDHPQFDPHGAPIPNENGKVPETSATRLCDLEKGQTAVIREIVDRNAELLRYLGSLGIYPDIKIEVLDIAPFNGPITIRIKDQECSLGCEAASFIYVTNIL